MGRAARLTVVAMCVALVGAACGGTQGPGADHTPSGGATIKNGGVFRLGTDSGIDSLNPFVGFQADAYTVYEYSYPYRVQYDKNLNFVGDFAKSWTTSPDGLVWTFQLTPGAQWSDGKPLTSADAAWTFNTMLKFQNGPTSLWAGNLSHMTKVVATSPTTLEIDYKSPVANVLSQLQQVPILPEHIWAKYAKGNGKALKTFPNSAPIVSGGPFILVKYVKDQIALFQKNPKFYGPKPHIDGWGLQYFANADAMITALKNHQIDAVETVPPTDVATVKAAGFQVNTTPSLEFYDFIINSNPKKTSNRELLNPMVREAFDYAINRDQIVQTSYLGFAQPGDSIVPPASGNWHDPKLKPWPYDIAKANQILDSLGYKRGSNGIRIANGHPMSYQVIFPTSLGGTGDRTFQIIQQGFQQIGVKLVQHTLDPTAAFDAIGAPNWKYLNFDLAMWDWFPYKDPDFILSVLQCNQYGGWSDTGYCNPAYDKLYQEQGTVLDQAKRQQIVYQMQDMIYNARPYLVLAYPDVIEAISKQWTGWQLDLGTGSFSSDSKTTFENIHQVG